MRFYNQARKYLAVAVGITVGTVGSAVAAVPADVTTAMADMKTDSLAVGTAFVVAVIALKALHLMKRA